MRQGQQNRRGRGRNRKGQSPLTRSFESTGPDVKLRGTPAHIAEKYMSLARDASSSGDPVLAENYLQHAEHYNRIIMAFRDQNMGSGGDGMNGGARRPFQDGMDGDEFGDEDGDEMDAQPSMQPVRQNDYQAQPRMDNPRFEGHRGGNDQNRFRDRGEHRNNRPDRNDRGQDRGPDRSQDRGGEPRHFQPPAAPQQHAEPGVEGPGPQQPSPENQMRRRERFPQQQPEFLRRPVRRPRRDGNGEPNGNVGNGNVGPDDTDRD